MKIPQWLQRFNQWTDDLTHSIPTILTLGVLGILFGSVLSRKAVWFMVLLTGFGLILVAIDLIRRKRGDQ